MTTSSLYVVQRADGLIKIGITRDVETRLRSISRVHGPLDVCKVVAGGREMEAELHNRLSRWRQFGEWFLPQTEVLDAVAGIKACEARAMMPKADAAVDEIEKPFVIKAQRYIKACLDARTKRFGAAPVAQRLEEIALDYDLSPHTLRHIRSDKVKSLTAGLYDILRDAAVCEMELALEHLRAELAEEEAKAFIVEQAGRG